MYTLFIGYPGVVEGRMMSLLADMPAVVADLKHSLKILDDVDNLVCWLYYGDDRIYTGSLTDCLTYCQSLVRCSDA